MLFKNVEIIFDINEEARKLYGQVLAQTIMVPDSFFQSLIIVYVFYYLYIPSFWILRFQKSSLTKIVATTHEDIVAYSTSLREERNVKLDLVNVFIYLYIFENEHSSIYTIHWVRAALILFYFFQQLWSD